MPAPSRLLTDRVIRPAPGVGFDLYIFTMYEKPGWRARTRGDRIRTAHPGTAISYGDAVYELIQVDPAEGTPYAYRCALRKWDDRFVVRQIFPYTLETAQAVAAEVQERRKQHRRHAWLIYLFPITGLLPTPLLQRWQREWGLPMRGASLASTILFGLLSAYLLSRRQPAPARTLITLFIPLFIFLEQVLRFFWLLPAREAVGSLTVTAVWGLANVARGLQPDGTPKRRGLKEYVAERDEVRRLKEQPWDLEVHSAFRVPALLGTEPVRFEDAVYEPLGYGQQGQGIYRRYVFRLKKLEDGRKAYREYNPERTASQVAALIPYERARDRVNAWALLCGYLPAARQLELEQKYEYNATQSTERSALVLLLAGGFQLSTVFIKPFDWSHLVAIYLMAESLYRLALARSRGEPRGSLFGWLLYPFLKF